MGKMYEIDVNQSRFSLLFLHIWRADNKSHFCCNSSRLCHDNIGCSSEILKGQPSPIVHFGNWFIV